jgi:hypothetical protein
MSGIQGTAQLIRRIHAVGTLSGPHTLKLWQVRTVELAKRNIQPHRVTGNLGRTIRPGAITPSNAKVEAGADYASYVEFGTRPHIIVPRYAKVLAWGGSRRQTGSLRSGSEATMFAMRVHHPGTRPIPFLAPAADQAVKEIGVQVIETAWNEAA